MHIGFDAKRIFQNSTGLGNYSRSLVRNVATFYPGNDYYLFTPATKNNLPFDLQMQNVHLVTGKGSVWRSFGIRKDMVRHGVTLYHGLSNELPFSMRNTDIRSVVTIHDLIFERFPQYYPGIDRTFYDIKSKFAVRNCDVIVAASASTKEDIIHFYHIPPELIHVIYQSCDDIFYAPPDDAIRSSVKNKYNLPDTFHLYVGSVTERKNVLNVCKAYNLMPEAQRIPCVVVGKGKRYSDTIHAYIVEHSLEKYFIFLDDVTTPELPVLYRMALSFIYPSLYEGFGIPILEAMVCGCPVMTSNVSSMPEVGGNAALYFDPEKPEDIAQKMLEMQYGDALRNTLVERGSTQAQQFHKEKVTARMMDLYSSLA